jgi:signal transduction histidine kinase
MGELDFKRIFEGAPSAYLVLTRELRIVAATDAYLRVSGMMREGLLGRDLFDAFPDNPDDPEADGVKNLRASLQRVLATGQPDTMPVQRYDVRASESHGAFVRRHWSPVNTPLFGDDGAVEFILHRVEDVTSFVMLEARSSESDDRVTRLQSEAQRMAIELLDRSAELAEINRGMRDAHDELSRLYEKTRELDRLKSQFFANVSHELRTPLTLILGPVERILSAADVDPRWRRDLKSIARNARTLLTHVNDLLDLTKLEAGRMGLALSTLDLARVARTAVAHFESLADERGISLAVDAPASILTVADVEKLQRVLLNLLANALRFTPEGGSVRCAVRADGERARIEVSDSGPGVPAHQRGVVFERFRQLDGGDTRRHGGSGLGLAIVREIVELHGGEVSVDQAHEGGARFTVSLPRRLAECDPAAVVESEVRVERLSSVDVPRSVAPSEASSDADPSLPRVLVVEDNVEMNRFIVDALSEEWRVESAFDGRTGVERAIADPPDVIVTDMMMPVMSGEDLVRAVRSHRPLDATPIVVLTARSDDDLRIRALRNGAQDFIAKPFLVDELRARLANLVAMRRAEDRVRRLGENLASRNRELESLATELKATNGELEAFCYSVAHDLRAPLRAIQGFSAAIVEDHGARLGDAARRDLGRVTAAATRMAAIIEDLLALSRVTRVDFQRERFDLSREAKTIVTRLRESDPSRAADVEIAGGLVVEGDPRWLRVALENVLHNAWKFTARRSLARIEVGRTADGAYFVRDNGAGFDPAYADRLFRPFQRLHAAREFEGTGVGLATVLRVVNRHGGRLWAEGAVDQGATFFFTLPRPPAERAFDDVAWGAAP